MRNILTTWRKINELGIVSPLVSNRISFCSDVYHFFCRSDECGGRASLNEALFALVFGAAGMAAGAFFIGYFVLQIPAGTWAVKFGSKRLVGVLLVLWGILAMASGLVQNSTELYVVRFALGLAEGGIWPATLVLLGNWFYKKNGPGLMLFGWFAYP